MIRALPSAFLGIALLRAASGQSTPAFEIAAIQPSARTSNANMSGGVLRAGRYELRKATMVDLIRTAYGVEAEHVVGGPSWLEYDRFDINAKAPPATSPETVKRMLQALLADRFKLAVHTDTRPMPAFVLSLGKGKPKLKPASGSTAGSCQPQPWQGGPIRNRFACTGASMELLTRILRNMAGGYIDNRVVDSTGLAGAWDFELQWTPRGALGMAGADGITIFDAVEKQLGLKLELQKVPTQVIVVDRANQTPTPNPPGVTTRLPPVPPAEFEVAVIKPSDPNARPGGGGFQPGRIDFRGVPLRVLITLAWNVRPGEELVGEPKWLINDPPHFDVLAKSSSVGGDGFNGREPIPLEDLQVMLRALLADRFKLATHFEDRPVTAYVLTANEPKLKPADPSNRTGCKIGAAPPTKNAAEFGPPRRQVTCLNITLAQLAEQLPNFAPLYTPFPALDASGVEGSWDITLIFDMRPSLIGGGGRGGGDLGGKAGPPVREASPAGDTLTASDPVGGITLFDALKQLGLKLEMQKRPMPVLVIDHVEPKPTEN
jgi:uncharacterized protein (TIGR03435 family)